MGSFFYRGLGINPMDSFLLDLGTLDDFRERH